MGVLCASDQVSQSLNQGVTLDPRQASARVSRKGTRAGAARPAGTGRRVAGAPRGQGDGEGVGRGETESARAWGPRAGIQTLKVKGLRVGGDCDGEGGR